jgi:hypothetical protein
MAIRLTLYACCVASSMCACDVARGGSAHEAPPTVLRGVLVQPPSAPDSTTACWPMPVKRLPQGADSAMAFRPVPHRDSLMVVRPTCRRRG